MLNLEPGGQVDFHRCGHCGEHYPTTLGFVERDGAAYAIYHAALFARHPGRHVSIAITIADTWSERAEPVDGRLSVALSIWSGDDRYEMHVAEGGESVWVETPTHAGLLGRDAALSHPRLGEVFHVADHVVEQDPEVHRFLESPPGGS